MNHFPHEDNKKNIFQVSRIDPAIWEDYSSVSKDASARNYSIKVTKDEEFGLVNK